MSSEDKHVTNRIVLGLFASLSYVLIGWFSIPLVLLIGIEREVFNWSLTGRFGATDLVSTIIGAVPVWLLAIS